MKTLIPFSIAAALAASGISQAQGTPTPAFSKPSGYVTQALNQGFNLVGITVQNSETASGTFTAANGTVLTDSNASFSVQATRIYILEIKSGPLAGRVAEVAGSSFSSQSITTLENLGSMSVGNAQYSVRLAPTLEEIFGVVSTPNPGGVIKAGLNALGADNVWIQGGSGSYDRYFLRSGIWRKITGSSTFIDARNTSVVYLDGILVERRDPGSVALTLTGAVKITPSSTTISQGFNLVNVVSPVGLTLRTAGLEDNLKGALNALGADNVWVQQPNGSYKRYFRRGSNPATATWREVDAPTVDLNPLIDPALGGAIFVERRDPGSVILDFKVPTSYLSL